VAAVSRFDAVVVGAGCAGLSAAVRLSQRGLRVLVLEARSRLGGRATAFRDRDTGELVDNGQHVLLGCYRETLSFLDEIGARGHLRAQRNLSVAMIDRAGVRSVLACPPLPAPWHLLAGAWRWQALGWRDRVALLRMAAPIRAGRSTAARDAGAGREIEQPVSAWLRAHGQTERLCQFLWNPLVLAALNQPPDHAAAAPFRRVLAEMFAGPATNAAILLPATPLHDLYAEPARRFVTAHGGEVRTGASGKARIAREGVTIAVDGESVSAPISIVAVPWFKLPETLDGDLSAIETTLANARATAASPIVTVNLWYDAPILDVPFVGMPDHTMQWVFDKARIVPGMTHLSLVASGAASLLSLTNEALVTAAHGELRAVLPSARSARLVKGTVIREPRATFSLAPGQPPRPASVTGVPGLYLAGDWIDTGLPATIEGAVRSGHAAADAAAAHHTRQ
jgi:squalene-associated FAD-dependent desaturase